MSDAGQDGLASPRQPGSKCLRVGCALLPKKVGHISKLSAQHDLPMASEAAADARGNHCQPCMLLPTCQSLQCTPEEQRAGPNCVDSPLTPPTVAPLVLLHQTVCTACITPSPSSCNVASMDCLHLCTKQLLAPPAQPSSQPPLPVHTPHPHSLTRSPLVPPQVSRYLTPTMMATAAANNIELVLIDYTQPLAPQGPFSAIIHKLRPNQGGRRQQEYGSSSSTLGDPAWQQALGSSSL